MVSKAGREELVLSYQVQSFSCWRTGPELTILFPIWTRIWSHVQSEPMASRERRHQDWLQIGSLRGGAELSWAFHVSPRALFGEEEGEEEEEEREVLYGLCSSTKWIVISVPGGSPVPSSNWPSRTPSSNLHSSIFWPPCTRTDHSGLEFYLIEAYLDGCVQTLLPGSALKDYFTDSRGPMWYRRWNLDQLCAWQVPDLRYYSYDPRTSFSLVLTLVS